MHQLIKHTADATVARAIRDEIIEPRFAWIRNRLLEVIKAVVRSCHDDYARTLDYSFADMGKGVRVDRFRSQLRLAMTSAEPESWSNGDKLDELLERQVASYEQNMDRIAAADALDSSEAWYKVSWLGSVYHRGRVVDLEFD